MTGPAPERCITCSDEAVEGAVASVHGMEAIVLIAGAERRVAVDLVPDARPGDVLLCHAGIALERVDGPRASPRVAQSHKVPHAPARLAAP